MDTSQSPNVLPMPRLRLSRNAQYTQSNAAPGPSRLPDVPPVDLSAIDERDEASDSTPKLMHRALAYSNDQAANTPATRLRALIASTTTLSQATPEPPPKSPSLLDSDLDTPPGPSQKSSIANVKQIFSFALRDPGGSPQKSRHRRNSIDGSEVEGSPVKVSTVTDKGKRKSASDEEVDRPSNSSLRSSQATSYNILREKLENSRTPLKNIPLSKLFDMDGDTQDTASLLRELSESTPPVATSTPQRSLQMPLFASQTSNLLEADSEMNRAMGALDATEISVPFPSDAMIGLPSASPFPNESTSTVRQHSADLYGSKQIPSSALHRSPSNPTNHSRRVSDDHDKLCDREWTKPQRRPSTPDLKHRRSHGSFSSGGGSPMLSPTWAPARRSLSRQSSAGSLLSQDDDFSSRASSISSQADHRERSRQQELELNHEREREWNKPHLKDHRSSSSMGHHSQPRYRTQSATSRPTSALSFHSPDRSTKRLSFSSVSSADSPNRSVEDLIHGVEHERERNWGSPRPQWKHGHAYSESTSIAPMRSVSPLPPASATPLGSPSANGRQDPPALVSQSPLVSNLRGANHSSSPSPADAATLLRRRSAELSERYAIPRSNAQHKENVPQIPMSSIPRSVSPFPPLANGTSPSRIPVPQRSESPVPPGPRPPSRARGQSTRIPVREHRGPFIAAALTSRDEPPGLDSRQLSSEETHPTSNVVSEDVLPSTDVAPSAPHEATPLLRAAQLPAQTSNRSLLKNIPSQTPVAEARLQALSVQELSPPPTPSSDERKVEVVSETMALSTPPRRSSFSIARIEFQTPSPPKGLPDLPGPPPSSEDETDTEETPGRPTSTHFSMMKTPKPPGSWADTPTPHQPTLLTRSSSSEPPTSEQDTGLVTPGPSLSKASALPLQTPAPPGGWLATPAPRKSILKVRFDPQPDAYPPSSQDEASAADISDLPIKSPPTPPADAVGDGDYRTPLTSKSSREALPDADDQEPSTSRSPRKVPSIRMLDAYGRETKVQDIQPKRPDHPNRSSMKILDAMGREVEDVGDMSVMSTDESSVLDHNEAVARVRLGLSALAHDMSDVDRSIELSLDPARLQELDTMSRAARETREKLSHTLHLARTSQEELRSKLAPLRASMRRSRLLGYDASPSLVRGHWNAWFFWSVVILQVVLVLAMYRLSHHRAKDIFMTTYYDPFDPNLHLYAIKPDNYDLAISPRTWSILALRTSIREQGWKSIIDDIWMHCMDVVSEWQKHAWELWGEESPRTWPPM